jgi:GntR family transcriptional regulator
VYTQSIDMHSGIVISQADSRPMYLQIMEQIKQRIVVGDWQPGQEIPSIRQLAVELSVSVITVKRAYLELDREGVIITQHGRGSIVAPEVDLSPRLYQEELHEHIEHVARLGEVLGVAPGELASRVHAAAERYSAERIKLESIEPETNSLETISKEQV